MNGRAYSIRVDGAKYGVGFGSALGFTLALLIFAGLRDAYLLAGNATARDVLVKLADWAVQTTRNMTDAQFQRMLGTEHGGMNEVLADVYAITHDENHLALAERFCHKAVLTPLSEGRDTLNGRHSNSKSPKFVGFKRLRQVTGKTGRPTAESLLPADMTPFRSRAHSRSRQIQRS